MSSAERATTRFSEMRRPMTAAKRARIDALKQAMADVELVELVAELQARHQRIDGRFRTTDQPHDICQECRYEWPCSTARLLRAIEELRHD